ncbi:hypothetical protein FRC11_012165, partial [Ceratobasidium sp. 423]
AIASPFIQKRSELEKAKALTLRESDDLDIPESDDKEEGPPEEEDSASIRSIYEEDFDPNEADETGEDDRMAPSCTLDPDDEFNEDLLDIIIPNLVAGSLDAKELIWPTQIPYNALWPSLQWLAPGGNRQPSQCRN